VNIAAGTSPNSVNRYPHQKIIHGIQPIVLMLMMDKASPSDPGTVSNDVSNDVSNGMEVHLHKKCRVRAIGNIIAFSECLEPDAGRCTYAIAYGNSFLCKHPDWMLFSADKPG